MPGFYLPIYEDNSMRVEVVGLAEYTAVDVLEFINDAAITATVKDSNDAEVSGQSWPLALAYETGSDGNYSGIISADANLSAGDEVTVNVTGAAGAKQISYRARAKVEYRDHLSSYRK
jgi:hypothetical protein